MRDVRESGMGLDEHAGVENILDALFRQDGLGRPVGNDAPFVEQDQAVEI